jgi:urease alpha subunit
MKRASKIVLVIFTMCIMLTGNAAFAESELQSETIAANSSAAVLAAAGITQAEAAQLGRLQGIIANMISSGRVTAQEAQNIVQ